MQIQVNSDNNVQTPEGFSNHVEQVVTQAISRFSDQISRVELHFSDENSTKGGVGDKRCVIEVRINGQQPIVVTDTANSLHEVTSGAASKLKHLLTSRFERQKDVRKN